MCRSRRGFLDDNMTEMHVSTTGQLFSFRPPGTGLEEREALFSAMRYGDGPDAVLITYGIQGNGYFRACREHWEEIMRGVKCIMGYVFPRHVAIYRRTIRGLGTVTEMWRGHPYGEHGPEMVWVLVERIKKSEE